MLRMLLLLAGVLVGTAQAAANDQAWLAGRYDGDQVIIYFQAVRFGNKVLRGRDIPSPVASGFFQPRAYTRQELDGVLGAAQVSERFQVGDKYELLTGNNGRIGIRLTSLVGFVSDEETGNESYVGALARPESRLRSLGEELYFAVQPAGLPVGKVGNSQLEAEPAGLALQEQMMRQLDVRWKEINHPKATNLQREPTIAVQSFRLEDGSRRYYARAAWGPATNGQNAAGREKEFALAGWFTTTPTVKLIATEEQSSDYSFEDALPRLRNVIPLGGGRTGLIVAIQGEDGMALELVEYRDGQGLGAMRVLQRISLGE